MSTCNCPFCPLVKVNLDCCGVMVKIEEKNKKWKWEVEFPEEYEGNQSFNVKDKLAKIGCMVITDEPALKKGECIDLGRCDCSCNVELISKSKKKWTYRMCFHTETDHVHNQENTPEEEPTNTE